MFDQDCEAYWEQADYLPVDAVISYWCSGNHQCEEAKTHALLGALERGEVQFRRRDGKDFPDPIHQLYSRNLILVERESFLSWARKISSEIELRNLQRDMPLSPKSETTYLNILGAVIEIMLSESPAGRPHSIFNSQAAIIDMVLATYPNKQGLSKRTIEEKLAAAKKSLNSD